MAINFIPKIVYDVGAGPVTITFDYPPEGDPLSEEIQSKGAEATSHNGTVQYSEYYQEELLKLTFKAVSKTIADQVRTFMKACALKGFEFDYYPHATEAGFDTYTLDKKRFRLIRNAPDGANDFTYKFDMRIRRTI